MGDALYSYQCVKVIALIASYNQYNNTSDLPTVSFKMNRTICIHFFES